MAAAVGLAGIALRHSQAAQPANAEEMQLWYWHHSFLSSDDALASSRKLVDKAAAAGYNGLALWDSGLNYMGNDSWPLDNEGFMRDLLKYAGSKHMRVLAAPAPYGYSNEDLENNPNWAESQRVVGSKFEVDHAGTKLNFKNSFPGLANGGFEAGKQDWFSTNDAGIGVNNVAHSGKNSAVVVDAPGNARFRQDFPLQPWRQYHVRLFYKSSNFRGGPMISVFDKGNFDKVRLNVSLPANGTHDWTQVDYLFNSQDSTDGTIYFGVWGGSAGILWFDDVSIEETSLVYLTRREGAPVKVYAPDQKGPDFVEGRDFKPITDHHMQISKPFTDDWHEPTPVVLPPGTHMKPGQTVLIDSYSAFPVPGNHSIAMCMTDPESLKWVGRNGKAIHHVLPSGGGLMLGFDEIRQMNSCGSCRAKHMTAGQLLSWSVGNLMQIYGKVAPGNALYIWNDMFDPFHNGRDNYFHVESDLAGAVSGVPAEVIVMNWNQDKLHDSLQWFSGVDAKQPIAHRQIIAGYYDTGNGEATAAAELKAANGVPGVLGFMYTTWNDDYSQMEKYSKTARAGWNSYRQSVRGK